MRKRAGLYALCAAVVTTAALIPTFMNALPRAGGVAPRYRSPIAVAWSPAGNSLAIADATADEIALADAGTGTIGARIPASEPWAVVWGSAGRLYAGERASGNIVEIDARAGRAARRIRVGSGTVNLAISARRSILLAANAFSRDIAVVNLAGFRRVARIPVGGEPFAVAVTPDDSLAVVGQLIPSAPATDRGAAASVCLIDLNRLRVARAIRLPSGSTNARGIAVSPDGRWAYVVHTVGRFQMPTTQLDRGWVNTNAVTVLDLRAQSQYATLLLDSIAEGAADPWGVALDRDGRVLWITLAGGQRLARLDLARLHRLLEGKIPVDDPVGSTSSEYGSSVRNLWAEIRDDPAKRSELVNDLSALHLAGVLKVTPVAGNGPRGIALSPDGRRLAVALYFTGRVALQDATNSRHLATVSPGPQPRMTAERRGEMVFHDATVSFQRWLSCATCHPDGRANGHNWDLLNDGIGNPKNVRSLLHAHRRGPMMAHGVRQNMEVAAEAGFRKILFREPQSDELASAMAYIRSLRPATSPYRLQGGRLSARAARGKALFFSRETRCATCHSGPLYTDGKIYDVGTRSRVDSSARFVTSTLVEVWRTAPYLHDGRAVTIDELFTTANPSNRHGVTSHLTREQKRDLSEFVLSL